MTSNSLIDLDSLPPPQVVEQLNFEAILRQKLQTYLGLAPEQNALLESDPAIKLLEADSYEELLLRQRINDAARARLLAFATGADLDQLAAPYASRAPGELDIPFKTRVRQAIMSRSAAGTRAQYTFAALSASVDVADVRVDSPSGGIVRISVLSRIGSGAPSEELLGVVEDVVTSDTVHALCHTVQVVGAVSVSFNVSASVWLRPTASQTVFDGLSDLLRTKFNEARSLGWNVAPSWLAAQLQVNGVQRIEGLIPATQVAVADNQYPNLNTITLTLAGRDY